MKRNETKLQSSTIVEKNLRKRNQNETKTKWNSKARAISTKT